MNTSRKSKTGLSPLKDNRITPIASTVSVYVPRNVTANVYVVHH